MLEVAGAATRFRPRGFHEPAAPGFDPVTGAATAELSTADTGRRRYAAARFAERQLRLAHERGAARALGSLIEQMGGAPGSLVHGDVLSRRA